jgi:hypothetical protein
VQEAEAEAQAGVGDGPPPQLRRGARRLGEAEGIAQQIESELARARSPRAGLDSKDLERLAELERRQQQAGQRGEELGRRMAEAGTPGMSSVPRGAGGDVAEARRSISDSARELSRHAPGRGSDAAGHAAEHLDAARKQVGAARHGRQEESGASHDNNEKVTIPTPQAAPRAFREELLDAMKRGAPRRFEEQVQKYYEELVR